MVTPLTRIPATILVVEDNPLVLTLVSLSLTRAGFTTLSAAGADEARQIEGCFSGTIDLLISDVIMLHSSGRDLAEELKARRPAMRAILMSGRPDDVRLLNYVGHFLQKPFLPSDLLHKVKIVLSGEVPALFERSTGCGAGQ